MADVDKNKKGAEFEEYRRRMHREEEAGRSVVPAPRRPIAVAFAIFMIIIYVGVGVLFLVNFFKWDPSWEWARIVIGVLLILYGIFRAYRQIRGAGPYAN